MVSRRRRSVLIIIQNLALPGDRRVWLECRALRDAGWDVATITPMGHRENTVHRELEGIQLYCYPTPVTGTNPIAYVREFAYCWLQTARMAITVWRRHRFTVIQACNPPDTFWLLALLFRPLGVKFVFDQHDLCPEVYLSRGGNVSSALLRGTYWLEKMTYRFAHRVISTNESYKANAIGRGAVPPENVTVVRTGPDADAMVRGDLNPELRRGREFLAVYIGVMGPQDGVDVLIEAIAHYVNGLGREDCTFAVLGSGDCWNEIRDQVHRLRLEAYVYLPGRVSDEELFDHLSTADIGLCPDPPSPLNNASTMNKTMEYMAFEVPVVAFELVETRFSAQDAAVYVQTDKPADFASAVADLLDDGDARKQMSASGRTRVEDVLAWRHQAPNYVGVFESLRPSG